MSIVKILGVDPSMRNTGLAVVSYDTEKSLTDINAYKVSHCQVLVNPLKYKGTEGILNMLDMMSEESKKDCYKEVDTVLVESPPIMFNKAWSSSVVSLIAHISGGAVAIFGIDKAHLYRPNEWNKNRKKDISHNNAMMYLQRPDQWHYEKPVRNEKNMEHILDAAAFALWWIKGNYHCE